MRSTPAAWICSAPGQNRELSGMNLELTKAEAASEQARAFAGAIVHAVRDALLVLDDRMRILRANEAYYARFKAGPEDTEGCLFSMR